MIAIGSKKVITKKIIGFEYLRIICAIAVVAIHSFDTNSWLSSVSSKFLKFPVPLFLMMSFFLLFNKMASQNNSVAFVLKKRCDRLVPAFLVWSVIYLAVRLISGSDISLSGESITEYLLFGDAALQLYYIPLVIYFGIVLVPLIKIVSKKSSIVNSIILIVSILIAAIAQVLVLKFNSISDPELNSFLYYLGYDFIYALMGIYLAYSLAPKYNVDSANNVINFLHIALTFAIISCIYFIFDLPQTNYLLANIFLFLLFYYASLPKLELVSNLSKISFGVYLSHHLFVEFLQVIVTKFNWNINNFYLTFLTFMIATIFSISFSFILYKNHKLKFLAS
ncbi:MAG: hypothetical protein Tsb0014_20340 [Pleurocapsa sp.]